ncbi:MAG TPA: LacI family DNA-binding transcriptional regulator [Companilactobacillus farciminis]|uniref:LacI family DNA-binding transcriptional regulator n=1 Tax=Companilactobacillus farciminis TaxID=1612 RepID=A0A921HQQ7_9LACO|nr:LacI family DNA-binding transcriptional regulator [Companilactobacillus farciminis]
MKKPTMNDVAKAAGVGRGTVSNYINGLNVRSETKKRIQLAIDDLGYIPNLQARELKTSKNSTVVLIVPTSWTPFFSELVYKMQIELNSHGYKMILTNSQNDSEEEEEILKMASLNQVSGVITMSYSDVYNFLNIDKRLNLVSIERYVSENVPLITSDNYAGGQLAAKKLIEMGSKRFLLLRREVTHHNATDVRTQGFKDYITSKHYPLDIFEATLQPSYREEYSEYLKSHYSNGVFPFDGIFAVTDEYGQIAQKALAKLDINLLKKVHIVGFDGSRISRDSPLMISSIRQPVDEIVKESVAVLLKKINGMPIQKNYKKVLPVTFVDTKNNF